MMENLILQAQGSTEGLRKDSRFMDFKFAWTDSYRLRQSSISSTLTWRYNPLRKPLPIISPILRKTLQEEYTDLKVQASKSNEP